MKNIIRTALTLSILSPLGGFSQGLTYPTTLKTDQKDTYFETTVEDPYRWLEDDQSPATAEWVKAENEVTNNYLNQIPFRDSLKKRMQDLWNFPKYSVPVRCGSGYFYFRSDALKNQPLLFFMKSLEYVPMAYFDPNKLSDEGTTAISSIEPSPDGAYLAMVISESGSDWSSIRIKEVKSGKTLPEKLGWLKFSNIAWYKDGFFYSRFDAPADGNILSSKNEFQKVYYHKINTEQISDSLVFEDKEHALRNFGAMVSNDKRYFIISGTESTSGNCLYVQDLQKPGSKPVMIVKSFENDFDYIGVNGNNLLFMTNFKAPRKKIIAINPQLPGVANWKDLIPEQSEILQGASICWNKMLVHSMKDASSRLYEYALDGTKTRDLPLNGIGTVDGIGGSPEDSTAFISFTTFTSPAVIYKYNVKTARMGTQFKTKLTFDPDQFVTEQVFYTSKDGTKIPMFLVHKKGYTPDKNTPTLLFGYGGFNISKTPEFKPERLVFLEQGGLFAMANIRGGGEYGTAWHEAGTKLKKQNVFDDFIAAAEYLIKQGYTNSSKLAISGRSNGGLLIGAVMTQRPDLFKVALPAVGVMDMLRFHKFTIGWAWKSDYGSSENAEEFKYIYKYSPLHNIKSGVSYPATMVTTGDHDDRVVPAHSFKFAATLQDKNKGEHPMLIRIDSNAGHGSGKPTGKLIDEQADIFSFLFYNLGMTL